MMFWIGRLGVDVKWARSGEWTVTKRPSNQDIQYALWLWLGLVRNGDLRAIGLTIGPLKVLVGLVR